MNEYNKVQIQLRFMVQSILDNIRWLDGPDDPRFEAEIDRVISLYATRLAISKKDRNLENNLIAGYRSLFCGRKLDDAEDVDGMHHLVQNRHFKPRLTYIVR